MITDVEGVRAGHWTDDAGITGCTVVLFPEGTVASGEVRGGAPGTREWALLAPERTVSRLDAVVLAGGSAPGLAAADGVSRWCAERGLGFPTAGGPVPIVVAMVLYDRGVGDPDARPDADAGYAACASATAGPLEVGPVGAGCGATVAKWRGRDAMRPGGIGSATLRREGLVVSALVAVNAWGDLRDPAASAGPLAIGPLGAGMDAIVAQTSAAAAPAGPVQAAGGEFGSNTTIGVVATNAVLDKVGCLLVAQSGHDGLARALEPVHSQADGDALVAAATGSVEAPLEVVRLLAARVVEHAVRAAVPSDSEPAATEPRG